MNDRLSTFLTPEEIADAKAEAIRLMPAPKRKRPPEPDRQSALNEPAGWSDDMNAANAAYSQDNAEDSWQEGDDPGFVMIGDAKIENVPVIIERLLPAEGITFLAGQSGVGKTFAAIQMAVALATGGEFLGYPVTERCGTIYIAAEGPATIAPRLMAAIKAAGACKQLPIAIIKEGIPNLSDDKERRQFLFKIKRAAKFIQDTFGVRVGNVTIDTIAKGFGMKDENSAAETQAVLDKTDELGRCIGAATTVVAHYGKAQETGIRGSSARRGYGESIIALTGDRNELDGTCKNRKAAHTKNRTGEEGPLGSFDLVDIDLGADDNGKPLTSGYFKFEKPDPAKPVKAAKEPSGGGFKCFKAAIHAVWGQAQTIQPFNDDPRKAVNAVKKSIVADEFMSKYPATKSVSEKDKQAAREKACDRAILAATSSGFAHYRDIPNGDYAGEWLWLTDERFCKTTIIEDDGDADY